MINRRAGMHGMERTMEDLARRPVATPAFAVRQTAPHQILVCKACKHTGLVCEPGHKLLKQLRDAISSSGLSGDFDVSGTACLAGCVPSHGRGCVVAFRASTKATWMFGDIDPAEPIDDLIAFSRLYCALDDGWCSGKDCPPRLCANTLARIPTATITTQAGRVQ
jgi:predicted metal-binding protein